MQKVVYLLLFISLNSCGTLNPHQQGTKPVSHEAWTSILQQFVNEEGLVDYEGLLKERKRVTAYLQLLLNNAPNDSNWSDSEQIAYWINLYNVATIDLVLEHYPIESIKDIGSSIQVPFVNTPWDIKFLKIAGELYDLNNLEHNILRKRWKEPRIHFAINCASLSCPKLRREAYTGDQLEAQLEEQAFDFINDDFRNDILEEGAHLSKIFSWFGGDFEENGSIYDFINQYADPPIVEKASVDFLEYNWLLNAQK